MDVRKILISGFGLVVLILLYTIFFSGDDSSQKKKSKSEQLAILLGESGGTISTNSTKRGHRSNDGKSIFDSEFANVGVNNNFLVEENSDVNSKSDYVIPINPQTGKPYDDEAMEQFEKLQMIFPGNNLIPRKLTKEEKAAKDREEQDYANATAAFINNTASKEQVKMYFEKQEKTLKDRLEIIDYLIDAKKEDGTLDKDGQFEKIIEGVKNQLSQIESQKKDAYQKYGL
jgi:hypothetical protein